MKLNEKIKKLRRSRRLTQSEFAKALGISTGYLSQIEMGIRLPSRALLKRMADMYGASLDYLLLDATPSTTPGVPEEIAEFFRSEYLSDHDRDELLSLFEWWRGQRNKRESG
jgi:transcriptional regulator with XRE-family HTH domain